MYICIYHVYIYIYIYIYVCSWVYILHTAIGNPIEAPRARTSKIRQRSAALRLIEPRMRQRVLECLGFRALGLSGLGLRV